MDHSQTNGNSQAQNKENITNGIQTDGPQRMDVVSEPIKPNVQEQADANDKKESQSAFEIVNEKYKTPGEEDEANIQIKVSDKDEKDKDKKKKKKKNKKKDKKNENEREDPDPTKKVKTSVLDNKNIPEELRQKYYEIEKNSLAVAIANIPIGINKSELLTYFTTLLTSLQDVANPIRNIEVGATGNFAIMELDTKDMRDYCLTLENLELKGYKLEMQRVKGFFNKVYNAEAAGLDPFGNISTASNEENKLYVGSIPLFLKEEDVRKICEAFGFLRYFNLVKDNEGNHKGYCFIEYMDTKSAEKALKGLNEVEIGDRKLKVQKAVAVSAPKVVAAPVHGAKPTNSSGSFLLGYPGISDLNVQSMLNVPASSRTPSRVIQILNMCTIEDLLEDDFYQDLIEDAKEEAAKFGPVESVVIPRPDAKTGVIGPSVGKIFVKFQYLIPSKQARHRLAGRSYNRRTIVTSFYPEDKFDNQDYLVNPF